MYIWLYHFLDTIYIYISNSVYCTYPHAPYALAICTTSYAIYPLYRRFRGELVADGSFTNDIPVFKDNLHRQLVFNLDEVDYSIKLRALPIDDCIEVFVLRGAMLMAQFLEGNNNKSKVISWLDRGETTKDLKKTDRQTIFQNFSTILYSNKYKIFFSWWLMKYINKNINTNGSILNVVINTLSNSLQPYINRIHADFNMNLNSSGLGLRLETYGTMIWNNIIKLYS